MAFHQLLSVFLLLIIFIYPSHSFSVEAIAKAEPASSVKSNKVDLSLYYESLCPFCKAFIVDQLVNLFNTHLISSVNLKLRPWGNAALVQPNNTIVCQHGEDECYLNIIHACAINIWPDPERHFGFIRCVENGGVEADEHSEEAEAIWKLCSKRWGLNKKAIEDCYESGYGRKIVLQYSSETDRLNPPRTFVPWVTVNNQPLYGDYNNFVSYICKAYQGKTVPEACRSPLSPGLTEKQNLTDQACYTGEAINLTLFNPGRNSEHNG